MKATLRWREGVSFEADDGLGHTLITDGAPEAGGQNAGFRPMGLVLIGAGACTAFDVVEILRKMRQPISGCEVEMDSDRADAPPRVFTRIHLHFKVRGLAARRVLRQLEQKFAPGLERDRMGAAFRHNTRPWHSIFRTGPVGWGRQSRRRLHRVIAEANQYVQILNDRFTDPSGQEAFKESAAPALAVVPAPADDPTKTTESGRP